MTVRCKFYVSRIVIAQGSKKNPTTEKYEPCEARTINLAPVYSTSDPQSENAKFWDATPAGQIEFTTNNPDAWAPFEMGKAFYVDFTPAS